MIEIIGKEKTKKAIIAIGEEIINRADDITKDLKDVQSITIYATLNAGEIANFDITKNYIAKLNDKKE